MGCCASRETASTNEAGGARNAQTGPNTALEQFVAGTSQQPSRAASVPSSTQARRGDARPNKPLRSPSPVARCPPERALQPWTRAQLGRERDAFFDTRVTGDPQMWSALRLVCEMLRSGDLTGAQNLMDSVGLTCPTGRIKAERAKAGAVGNGRGVGKKGGVFDERGNMYEIPGWIVAVPEDVVEDGEETIAAHGDDVEKDVGLDGALSDDDDYETEDGKREEKGKGRALDAGDIIQVRARLSNLGTDVQVELGDQQKVRVLVRKIQEKLASNKRLRLIYLGKPLSEDRTLSEQGWQVGHVINAFFFE